MDTRYKKATKGYNIWKSYEGIQSRKKATKIYNIGKTLRRDTI